MNEYIDGFSLVNKVALVTGTTRGLGQAMVEGLAQAGAIVIALDRSLNDKLPTFCQKIGAQFERICIDLSTASKLELEEIVEGIVEKYSRLDILVNNAGITRRGEVEEFKEQDWSDVLHVNLNIPFLLSQIVSKHFVKQKSGKIINVASMLSFQGGTRVPSYASSKHGIVGLTRSFAVGLGKFGINVNAIAPGFMESDMTAPLQNDENRNRSILERISVGRWGKGSDLQGALIFLASPMSNYVNGIVLPVDGGWLVG